MPLRTNATVGNAIFRRNTPRRSAGEPIQANDIPPVRSYFKSSRSNSASANPAARSPSWSVMVSSKSVSPMPVWESSRETGGIMRFSSGFRAALVALFALAGAGVSSAAHADGGTIWIEELKGGWFIGGSGGSGTLIFHGRRYPLKIGGLSAGLVFGGSVTRLYGYVSNIRYPSDVAGVYGGAGAGAALIVGARAIILRNEKGAVLRLSGQQFGLIANADVSGLAIALR